MPKLRPIDLAALVTRIGTEWQDTGRPLELVVEPVVARVDPAMVERILENLVANAARHTPPDTLVWVRVARQDQGVLIAVEDADGGVPPELRAALFEPFRQGRRPRRTRQGSASASHWWPASLSCMVVGPGSRSACPASGHHTQLGAWWVVQLACGLGLVTTSALGLRRG